MPEVSCKWEPLLLYLLFVPTKDRHENEIPHATFKSRFEELRERIKEELHAVTELEMKGKGETEQFGIEDTVLLLQVVSVTSEESATSFFETLTRWMVNAFDQTEVLLLRWIGVKGDALRATRNDQ